MDGETAFLLGFLATMIAVVVLTANRPAKDTTYRGRKAKRFSARMLTTGTVILNEPIPWHIYATEEGLWMGLFRKSLYTWSTVSSVLRGKGGRTAVTTSTGPTYYFRLNGKQTKEFVEAVRAKGVSVEE